MNTPYLALPMPNAHVGLQGKPPTERRSASAERGTSSSFQNELAAQSSPDSESDSDSTASSGRTAPKSTSAEYNGAEVWQQALRSSAAFGRPIGFQPTSNPQQAKATSDQTALANGPEIGCDGQADASQALSAAKATNLKDQVSARAASEAKAGKPTSTRETHTQTPSEIEQTSLSFQPVSARTEPEDTSSLSKEADAAQHSRTTETAEGKSVDATNGANFTTPATGDLAVALQVRSGTGNSGTQSSAEEGAGEDKEAESSISNAGAHSQALALTPQQSEHRFSDATAAISSVADSQTQQASGQAEKAPATDAAKPADAADFRAHLDRAQSEPVRGAHVQIAGENDEKVDIRLFERGGVLSVTIRSGDTGLTRALQDHVPELTSRLSLDHFRTETWTPGASRSAEQPHSEGGSSSRHGSSPQERQNPNGRQGKQNQQQPDWVDELEAQPVPFFRKG